MLFVTNRTPRESSRTKLGRKITFSLQNTSVSQSLYFCERTGPKAYVEIGNRKFFSGLKELDNVKQILLYIHGFNNTGEKDIFPRADALQRLIDAASRVSFT